jgi:hypothetical protein
VGVPALTGSRQKTVRWPAPFLSVHVTWREIDLPIGGRLMSITDTRSTAKPTAHYWTSGRILTEIYGFDLKPCFFKLDFGHFE